MPYFQYGETYERSYMLFPQIKANWILEQNLSSLIYNLMFFASTISYTLPVQDACTFPVQNVQEKYWIWPMLELNGKVDHYNYLTILGWVVLILILIFNKSEETL